MHVQVVTFQLNGVTEEQYHEVCEAQADVFGNLPGLLAKIWLRDPATNTYGGVYLWQDREAFERYTAGEVFDAVKTNAALLNVTSADYAVFADLTKATQPEVLVVTGEPC